MLTNSEKTYFTSLIYNPLVSTDFNFTNIEDYLNQDLTITWSDSITVTDVEVYVKSSNQEVFVTDPLLYTDDDHLLINDYFDIDNFTLRQTLTGDKALNQSTDIKIGSSKETKVSLLDVYNNELNKDIELYPNENLPYLDTDKRNINRYLEGNWLKTTIRQTVFSNTDNTLTFKNVPNGRTVITVFNNTNCIAAFYQPGYKEGYLVNNQLSSNMQDTNIYDISVSLLLAAASKDYLALTNLLIGLCNLVDTNNFEGFYRSYDRLTFKPLNKERSVKDNAILIWSLSVVLSSIQEDKLNKRVSLGGNHLNIKLREVIKSLNKFLAKSFDPITRYCFKSINEYNEVQHRNNIETSFWVSLALAKGLNIEFDESVHEVAAKLFLSVSKIKTLNSGPFLNEFSFISWSEVREARYIWSQEFSEPYIEESSFSESEYLGNLILDSEYKQQYIEEIKQKPNTTRLFKEQAFVLISETDFSLINKRVFDLLAKETEGYIAYLDTWSKHTWPSGQKWNPNDKAYNIGTVLNALLTSNVYCSFKSALKIKRLENGLRLEKATGDILLNYSNFFDYREFESDTYWRAFLVDLTKEINQSVKLNEDYFNLFGLRPTAYKNLISEWEDPKQFDWFSSPEKNLYINKTFYPLDPAEEDYYYIAYYPKQTFLNSNKKITDAPILKTEYVKRPVPGFTYYLDCSQEVILDDELDITVDSNYYIDPIHKYVGQVWVNTLDLPNSLSRALELKVVAGVKINLNYYQVYKVS